MEGGIEGKEKGPVEIQQKEQINKEKIINVHGPGGGTALSWIRRRGDFKAWSLDPGWSH